MANIKKRGIFCLETASWDKNLVSGRQTSYEHLLRFLEASLWNEIPHRHYDVAAKAEFEFLLKKWKESIKEFPILLLAFHGDKNQIGIFEDDKPVFADEITHLLHSEKTSTPNNAIIHFSSCYHVKKAQMEELLYRSGALSVSCYMNEDGVGWHTSAAFELLFLTNLFTHYDEKIDPPKDTTSMRHFTTSAENKTMLALGKKLGFNLWYRVSGKGKQGKAKPPTNIHPISLQKLKKAYED